MNIACLHCDKPADAYRFCGQDWFRLSDEVRKELEETDGQSYLIALRELERFDKPNSRHGFVNGKAFWQMLYQAPIDKDCTVRVEFTGVVTVAGLDLMIRALQEMKKGFQ